MDTRTVGVLGGGQLGRMFVEAANNRNISVAILDKKASPAKQISAHPGIEGSFTNAQAIRQLASKCDILTVEIEHVDTHVLEELQRETETNGKKIDIQPSWETIRMIQDKYLQKQRLIDAKVDVAKSKDILADTEESLRTAAGELDLPFMLKARTGAYDGRGNYPVRSPNDYTSALSALKGRPLYAEQWANFTMELAVMVVKTKDAADPLIWESSTKSYPTVETVHQDSICKLVYAPARGLSEKLNDEAQELARKAVASFKGKGVFGVEMFLLKDDTILANEIAPRPHNSGHYTIEACRLSQYDAHLLAILDRPIHAKSLQLLNPAIMLNILGGADPKSYLTLANAADAAGAKVHLYGKGDATKGRKMGHLTLVGDSMPELEDEMRHLIRIADRLHDEQPREQPLLEDDLNSSTTAPKANPKPLVSITTGSISDQEKLQDCYRILNQLSIPFEKRITSAHRTPSTMAAYGSTAPSSSIKVIVAAAGGAAHLPGMVAAFSKTVPVIGLPIKPTIGDGWDSLVSCTNMPRGCPVLTVGVNNATNAALGAARILAGWDEGVQERLEGYVDRAEAESLENDRRLQEEHEQGA
ncbi:MAG: phosphoribosylaminoimidazole carboxylase ade2 [Alectoria fallacina]|uniref:Phosphoribosylaminoimidazole carboxylase n=1 Tax=Alectoria fallacina TaxID=1903189 RepID=A0A8H3G7L7_9LECA|nr:MAG: phosphoribosylaminoimidazole carboxylase ade2 [Alectoria fallacina]